MTSDSLKAATRRDPASTGSTGFRATLNGLGVSDLVQMNCLSGLATSVKVTSNLRVGWLHFAFGAVVHASAKGLVGDEAVLEILSWQQGSCEHIAGLTPESRTVETGWQNLLLLAAQLCDEADRATQSSPPRPRTASVQRSQPISHFAKKGIDNSEVRAITEPSFSAARVDVNGNKVAGSGDTEDLVAQGAYAARMAQMIADALGLERARGIELAAASSHTVVALEDSGEIYIVQSDADNVALRDAREIGGL